MLSQAKPSMRSSQNTQERHLVSRVVLLEGARRHGSGSSQFFGCARLTLAADPLAPTADSAAATRSQCGCSSRSIRQSAILAVARPIPLSTAAT
jgi:hypothetical protein